MYTKEELREYGVLELRKLGMEIGVRLPSTLKKAELIEEIIQVKNGLKAPYVKNKMGRRLTRRLGESLNGIRNKQIYDLMVIDRLQKAAKAINDAIEILKSL